MCLVQTWANKYHRVLPFILTFWDSKNLTDFPGQNVFKTHRLGESLKWGVLVCMYVNIDVCVFTYMYEYVYMIYTYMYSTGWMSPSNWVTRFGWKAWYLYMYVHVWCIYIYIYVYMYLYMYIYTHTYIYTHVYTYIYIYIYIYVYTDIYMSTHAYTILSIGNESCIPLHVDICWHPFHCVARSRLKKFLYWWIFFRINKHSSLINVLYL